jgi:hypothetical protein
MVLPLEKGSQAALAAAVSKYLFNLCLRPRPLWRFNRLSLFLNRNIHCGIIRNRGFPLDCQFLPLQAAISGSKDTAVSTAVENAWIEPACAYNRDSQTVRRGQTVMYLLPRVISRTAVNERLG